MTVQTRADHPFESVFKQGSGWRTVIYASKQFASNVTPMNPQFMIALMLALCFSRLDAAEPTEGHCCSAEIKHFYGGDISSADFQEAVLEPNITYCDTISKVLKCLRENCTGTGNANEKALMMQVFASTQTYCDNAEELQEALKCSKDANTEALADSNNMCNRALKKANESETNLATSPSDAFMVKYCEQQGIAWKCMEDDENQKKCTGLEHLYTYLQRRVQSQQAMLNTRAQTTQEACAKFTDILNLPKNHTPKPRKRLCCDQELEAFNSFPISETIFQKSILKMGKTNCDEAPRLVACFKKCPESSYVGFMSKVFDGLTNFCINKDVYYEASECFEKAGRQKECIDQVKTAKIEFSQLLDSNNPLSLENVCQELKTAIECVEKLEAKRIIQNCSNNIYNYYNNLVDTKKALIGAINIVDEEDLETNLDSICLSLQEHLKKNLNHDQESERATTTSHTKPNKFTSSTMDKPKPKPESESETTVKTENSGNNENTGNSGNTEDTGNTGNETTLHPESTEPNNQNVTTKCSASYSQAGVLGLLLGAVLGNAAWLL